MATEPPPRLGAMLRFSPSMLGLFATALILNAEVLAQGVPPDPALGLKSKATISQNHSVSGPPMRWGSGPDQTLWLDPSKVAMAESLTANKAIGSLSSAMLRVQGLVDKTAISAGTLDMTRADGASAKLWAQNASKASLSWALPVLTTSSGQIKVPLAEVIVSCAGKDCEEAKRQLTQRKLVYGEGPIAATLSVATPPGLAALELAASLQSVLGVKRADPDFWQPPSRK